MSTTITYLDWVRDLDAWGRADDGRLHAKARAHARLIADIIGTTSLDGGRELTFDQLVSAGVSLFDTLCDKRCYGLAHAVNWALADLTETA